MAAAILGLMLGQASAGAEQVNVGLAGPMTGRYASYGQALRAGAELAIADLNTAGGVLGRRLILKIEDDQCQRDRAAEAARGLVAEGVVLVVGHFCSSASFAAADVYSSAGVIQIIPAMTGPWPTDAASAPTLFHLRRDDDQGDVAGRFLAAHKNDARVAIVHDRTTYGHGLASGVRQAMRQAGREEVLFAPVRAGEKDYAAVVEKVKAANADILYFGGYPTEAAIIIRQLREAGLATTLLSGDALTANDFWDLAGEAGEGTLLTAKYDISQGHDVEEISRRLRERAIENIGDAMLAYVAFQIWARSASATGSSDPAAIAARIASGTDTVAGIVRFDRKRRGDIPAFAIHAWTHGRLRQAD